MINNLNQPVSIYSISLTHTHITNVKKFIDVPINLVWAKIEL